MTLGDPLRLSFALDERPVHSKGFTTTRWQVSDLQPGDRGPWTLALRLFLSERSAYRFNLTGRTPRLFIAAGEAGGIPRPTAISASQEVAAAWLDGEQRVLEVEMPLAVQARLEAYLARHGEAPDQGARKQRRGAGRAREQQP